jgi:hypothetical protein
MIFCSGGATFGRENVIITNSEVKHNAHAFNLVMEKGLLVVRPLMVEDVNRLGPACLATIFGVV